MYDVGSAVVYKREVCKIKDIKEIRDRKYYVIVPVTDESLIINVPVDGITGIRNIISKEKVDELIKKIPSIDIIDCDNDKFIEYEYKNLLYEMSHEGLIKIIKTTYVRNKERLDNKRKIGEKDDTYFKKAEKLLYTEFSLALGMSYDETKEYVLSKVQEEIKRND